jgi:hypothetical protein
MGMGLSKNSYIFHHLPTISPSDSLGSRGLPKKIIHGQMRKVKGPEKSPVHAPGILEFSIIWNCSIWKVEDSSYHGHTMSFMIDNWFITSYNMSCTFIIYEYFWFIVYSSFVMIISFHNLVGGFQHFLFSISYIGCHPSHWRTPSCFKMFFEPPIINHH